MLCLGIGLNSLEFSVLRVIFPYDTGVDFPRVSSQKVGSDKVTSVGLSVRRATDSRQRQEGKDGPAVTTGI